MSLLLSNLVGVLALEECIALATLHRTGGMELRTKSQVLKQNASIEKSNEMLKFPTFY